jgi:hypothetical protein
MSGELRRHLKYCAGQQGPMADIEADLIRPTEAAALHLPCGCAEAALAAREGGDGRDDTLGEENIQLLVKVNLPRRSVLGMPNHRAGKHRVSIRNCMRMDTSPIQRRR